VTPYTAAQAAGVAHDDAMVLQGAVTKLLVAAAQGKIDLNAMARTELANRGMDATGRWVGFDQAIAALAG